MPVKGFYGDNFYGIINGKMIFNRALTQGEIAWLYNSQKPAGMGMEETKLKSLASILSAIQSILEKIKALF